MEEHQVNETRYTVGPGIKHAILWISFIVTFLLGLGMGWYLCNGHYENDSAVKQVEILQDDTQASFEMMSEEDEANILIYNRQQEREYESACGDMLIRDVVK